jgi:hypothetical protein
METTKVIFKKHRDTGEIVAFFPAIAHDVNGQYMVCYAHIGQHSSSCMGYFRECIPATQEEYASLKAELESLGYTLKIARKITQKDTQERMRG